MGDHTPTATTVDHGPATTRRVVFTDTRWWAADVDVETADMLLDADICDASDVFTRLRRIDPHAGPVDAGLDVDAAEDTYLHVGEGQAIDGTKPESYYWSARKAVMAARYELDCGRYREGDCREMDAVNGKLTAIEDELRLLAMAVDSGRTETPLAASANGRSGGDDV